MSHSVLPLDYVLQNIEVLLRLDQITLALQAIDAVAQFYPEVQQLHLYRGWLWLNHGQPTRAIAAFRLAAGRDPSDALAWHGVAESCNNSDERSVAIERARWLSNDGPQAQLWYDLRSGKPHLAITALQAFCQRFPERAELTIWFAEVQRRLGNVQHAQRLIDPLLRRRPRAVPALFLAAAITPDPELAERYLHDALRIDPLMMIARRLFMPEQPPFPTIAIPEIPLSVDLAAALARLALDVPRPTWHPTAETQQRISIAKSADAPLDRAVPAAPADADTAAALSAVEQATQRLIGRTPLVAETRSTTALLVTHHAALQAQYGAGTAQAIIDALAVYGNALATRGVQAECVLIDRKDALTQFGNVAPATEQTAGAAKHVIDAVRSFIESAGRDVDAVVLIGGDAILPFHRLANPSQDADADVPSDNPYGCGAGSELAPDLIVARFPDGGADGGKLLIEQLERAAEYHQHWHVAGPQSGVLRLPFVRHFAKPQQTGQPVTSWGVSTQAWQTPSQSVFVELGSIRPLTLCPPATPPAIEAAWPGDARTLYFNLHGIQGGPNWYGQALEGPPDAPLPVALTPDDIGSIAPNMICVSEACYGAEITGRSAQNAVALRLLQSGALAFVGSTVTAYGAVNLPLGGADLLVQQTFQQLRRGYPLGRAVALARDWMAREMVQRQGYLDPDDAKTLLSFILLGDPWATPYTRPVLERKTAAPHIQPVVVQRRPVAANMIAPAAVNVARQLIAKVAPTLARADLLAVGQGRPDRIAKGQANAVVFSASNALPTTDGCKLAQIARITVAGGEARKFLLSR